MAQRGTLHAARSTRARVPWWAALQVVVVVTVGLVVAGAALWPEEMRDALGAVAAPLQGEPLYMELSSGEDPAGGATVEARPIVGPLHARIGDANVRLEVRLTSGELSADARGTRPSGIPPGQTVLLAFQVADANSGKPLEGLAPKADLKEVMPPSSLPQPGVAPVDPFEVRETYLLSGPMADLGILEAGEHASHTPGASLATQLGAALTAAVKLPGPSAEAALDRSHRQMFITLPKDNQVAVVDTLTRRLVGTVPVGRQPYSLGVEPSGKRLWVANDGDDTLTSVDVESHDSRTVPIGSGHHDLAFSADSRLVFATNSRAGTVSVVDAAQARKIADVPVGNAPHGLDFSAATGALYVANEGSGNVTVLAVRGDQVTPGATIATGAGATQVKIDRTGRVGVVSNKVANSITLFSTDSNAVLQTVKAGGAPDGIVILGDYAVVRNGMTPDVTFAHLDNPGVADDIQVGTEPVMRHPTPGLHARLFLDAAGDQVLVPIPGTNQLQVIHIMDGRPMAHSQVKSTGNADFVVSMVNKVHEVSPGRYQRVVRFEREGDHTLTIDLGNGTGSAVFSLPVVNYQPQSGSLVQTEHTAPEGGYRVGQESVVRLRLVNSWTGLPEERATDGVVTTYRFAAGQGIWQRVVPAEHIGNGIYQARVSFPVAGSYTVAFSSPSLGLSASGSGRTTVEVRD